MTSSSKSSSVDSNVLPVAGAETAVVQATEMSLTQVEAPAEFAAAREAEMRAWVDPTLSREAITGIHSGIAVLEEVALGEVRALSATFMTDALRGTELPAPLSHPASLGLQEMAAAFIARHSGSSADSAAVIQFPTQAKAA